MRLGTNSSREKMKERPLQREIQRCTEGTLAWFASHRLDKELVQKFILYRQESGANGPGVNRDLARLRNLLNDAADNGLELRHVPWRKLHQQEKPVSYRAMLDHEEEPILEALKDRIVRTFVETLLHTGIRPEACLRLRLGDHVDLERGSICVDA